MTLKHLILTAAVLFSLPANAAELIGTEVCVGDYDTLSLPANPTTGYLWQAVTMPEKQDILTVVQENHTPESTLVGAPGTTQFKVLFEKAGEATVLLRYFRPWETFNPEQDTERDFTYRVLDCSAAAEVEEE